MEQKELKYKLKHGNQINEIIADVQNLGEEIDIHTGRRLETKLPWQERTPSHIIVQMLALQKKKNLSWKISVNRENYERNNKI